MSIGAFVDFRFPESNIGVFRETAVEIVKHSRGRPIHLRLNYLQLNKPRFVHVMPSFLPRRSLVSSME
jgi:hypothetical protein